MHVSVFDYQHCCVDARGNLVLLLYTDDLIVDGDHQSVMDFLALLQSRFDCNDPSILAADHPIDFIGIIIGLYPEGISMSMEPYTTKFLAEMNMSNCTPRSIPINGYIPDDSPELSPAQATLYRSGVGGIGWLANTTRPDMAFTFSKLGQLVAKPTEAAATALKQALRYLQGSKDSSLFMLFSDLSDTNAFTFHESPTF